MSFYSLSGGIVEHSSDLAFFPPAESHDSPSPGPTKMAEVIGSMDRATHESTMGRCSF